MKIHLHDLTHTISQAAPLLGRALAGPSGSVVGQLIASIFGEDIRSPHDLHTIIQSDPAATAKLQQLEADHEIALQRLVNRDRVDARKREAAEAAIPLENRDRTPAWLAYILTAGVLAALVGLFCYPVPVANQGVVLGLLSSLITVWVSAMGYYHGSSLHAHTQQPSVLASLPPFPPLPAEHPK